MKQILRRNTEAVEAASQKGQAARHCWKDLRDWLVEDGQESDDTWARSFDNPCTCLLPFGHEGSHKWTPDDEIELHFVSGSEVLASQTATETEGKK